MTQENKEIQVGDVVTENLYTDRHCYDVVARTAKSLTLRPRTPILVVPPVMVPGGFAGFVQKDATWRTESNPADAYTKKAYLRKDGKYHSNMGTISPGDHYYHDYAF